MNPTRTQPNEIDDTLTELPDAGEVIPLSTEDSLALAQMLRDPPAPNEHLRRAAWSHRELIGA